jgi:hypothetical protein
VLVFWCNFLNLSSTSYLSCIVDTSCKQTLLLAFLRGLDKQNNTEQTIQYFVFSLHSTLRQPCSRSKYTSEDGNISEKRGIGCQHAELH